MLNIHNINIFLKEVYFYKQLIQAVRSIFERSIHVKQKKKAYLLNPG